MENLVIVESPTKARTLSRFLGKDFQIEATMGHVWDLPKSKLGVDVDQNFTPSYLVIPRQKTRVAALKKLGEKAAKIILATDPDREGEAIAWHVAMLFTKDTRFQRIVFHEITEPAVREALTHPREIDMDLVLAQQARRILDRLVGYKLSPLLWKKVRRGLSAGRVQSVTVRLIVEREREIKNFVPEEYWKIEVVLARAAGPAVPVTFTLIEKDGQKYETRQTFSLFAGDYTVTKTTIKNENEVQKIVEDLKGQKFRVVSVEKREVKRTPPPPFTTSTLQQEAGRRFGFSAKLTMRLAQSLYEEGYITYHRTDSVNLSPIFLTMAQKFLAKNYGQEYALAKPRFYKTKSKLAQEAHEAIRPTAISHQPLAVSNQLGEAGKLYELIWQRAVASQTTEAILETTGVSVLTEKGYKFYSSGSVIKFPGFLKIYPTGLEETVLPVYEDGEFLNLVEILPRQKFTEPPPRYTEMSLIKTLEEKGIGRPSTYAPIISTIQERQYVEKDNEKRFIPTVLGEAVNDFLVTNFKEIMEIPFTAKMEDELDEIAQGEKEWVPVLREFYDPFEKKLEEVEVEAKRVKVAAPEVPGEKCDKCGAALVERLGKFGKFLACSRFPDCDFTKAYRVKTDLTCPRCGGEILLKKTRRGRNFYGCAKWPKCKFAAWRKEDIGQ